MSHRSTVTRIGAGLLSISLLAGGVLAPTAASAPDFPRVIELPDGFQPEGIAIKGKTAWFGSLRDGDIYEVQLRTGRGRIVSQGPGTASVGMKVDRRGRLFVAGGPTGEARVVNTKNGKTLESYDLGPRTTFVNDVVIAGGTAWFTDSFQPQFYALPLGPKGALPDDADVQTLGLTGEWEQGDDFGANGIEATPDGTALLVVHSTEGELYRVDTSSGVATRVDLDTSVSNGDGLLLDGKKLYVVRNQLNRVSVIKLDRAGTEGTLKRTIRSSRFDVPTTVAQSGERLYLPNARFTTTPTPTTPYTAVQVPAS